MCDRNVFIIWTFSVLFFAWIGSCMNMWPSWSDWNFFWVKVYSTEHGRGSYCPDKISRGWHKIRCRVSCRNKLKFLQNSKFVWRAQLLKCYLIIYLKSNHFVFLSMICLGVLRSHICVQSSELSRYCVRLCGIHTTSVKKCRKLDNSVSSPSYFQPYRTL